MIAIDRRPPTGVITQVETTKSQRVGIVPYAYALRTASNDAGLAVIINDFQLLGTTRLRRGRYNESTRLLATLYKNQRFRSFGV